MKIRKAKKEDARKISRLRRKTLKDKNKNDYPEVFLDFLIKGNTTKNILDKMKTREMFCACQGEDLMGTVDLEGDKIGGVFVKSSEIGNGIGTKLMDFIENYALSKKIIKVRLYSTKYALNFYKHRGFYLVKSGYWVIGKHKYKDKLLVKKLK